MSQPARELLAVRRTTVIPTPRHDLDQFLHWSAYRCHRLPPPATGI
ncbi:hypothetical protein [Streptomyces sp. bgisy034]